MPSPSVLGGFRPHKTLKKSDLKNKLISQPKLITHGLLAVHASKSSEEASVTVADQMLLGET